MPVVVSDTSKLPERIQRRRVLPRTADPVPFPYLDPNPPSQIQSSRPKPTISSLLSSLTSPTSTTETLAPKKKNFTSSTLRGLGCAASPQVSVPAAIRTAADWDDENRARDKTKTQRQRKQKKMKNKSPANSSRIGNNQSADMCCGPGMGFATDAAAVDCVVVSRREFNPGRLKIDGDKINQRERERGRERERPACSTRRMVNPEQIPFIESEHSMGLGGIQLGFDVFGGSRYQHHVRHPSPDSPEGFGEVMMFQSGLMTGGRSDRYDRHWDWRLDVDHMSYEELLALGDRIGYVNTGLKEDQIVHCLRKTNPFSNWFSQIPSEVEGKCSICQEDYEEDDDIGKLECGHFYHMDCVKQWLVQRNMCPICKTEAAPQ